MEERLIGIDLGSKFLKVCKILSSSQKNKELSVVSGMIDISALDPIAQRASIVDILKKYR